MSNYWMRRRGYLLLAIQVLLLLGCQNLDRFSWLDKPDVLFDGGSVVFDLTEAVGFRLMITPLRQIDPETGEILQADSFIARRASMKTPNRFEVSGELISGSAEEIRLLDYLRQCKGAFAPGQVNFDRLEMLIQMIELRTGPPPCVSFWIKET